MGNRSKIYKALAEIDDIILHAEDEVKNKIPQSFKDVLRDKKDYNYAVKIDYTQDMNNQKLLLETRELLGLIYTDYLCSEEERNEIINNNLEVQQKIVEKYSILNVFEPRVSNCFSCPEETLPIKYEDKKWYEIIIDKIIRLFKKAEDTSII